MEASLDGLTHVRTFPDVGDFHFFSLWSSYTDCVTIVLLCCFSGAKIDLPQDDSSLMLNSQVYFCSIIITNLPVNCVCPTVSTH